MPRLTRVLSSLFSEQTSLFRTGMLRSNSSRLAASPILRCVETDVVLLFHPNGKDTQSPTFFYGYLDVLCRLDYSYVYPIQKT